MRCLIATRSQGKILEIRDLLGMDPAIRIVTPDDVGLEPSPAEDLVEEFDSFRENAMAKALYFAALSGLPTIADDSGLVVDALGGAPGVHSKRFALEHHSHGMDDAEAGALHPDHTLTGAELDQANNELLLLKLQGVPPSSRNAHYACAVALALPARPLLITIGTCSGSIATEPRGTNGFGYDPLFLLPDLGRTFAEIPAAERNRRSHRARAFHSLRAHLFHFVP